MSADTIRSAVVAALEAIAGVVNVYGGDPFGQDAEFGRGGRLAGASAVWWIVKVSPHEDDSGLGWREPKFRVRVDAWRAVSTESPTTGELSEVTHAREVAAAVAALAPTVFSVGLENSFPTAPATSRRTSPFGARALPCHFSTFEIVVTEEES